MVRNVLLMFFAIIALSFNCKAQNFTKSYAAISSNSSIGPQAPPINMSTYIDFYDGYIEKMGERFFYAATNLDGSMQFYPESPGSPTLSTVGIVVASDYSAVREVQQSTMMGMSLQIWYDYAYIGDGAEPALNYSGASARSMIHQGGVSGSGGSITCHSCGGHGRCKYCNGLGRDPYTSTGRCEVCRGTGRCAGCDGKGSY